MEIDKADFIYKIVSIKSEKRSSKIVCVILCYILSAPIVVYQFL